MPDFKPIEKAPGFEYRIEKLAGTKDQALTVQWKGRTVTCRCSYSPPKYQPAPEYNPRIDAKYDSKNNQKGFPELKLDKKTTVYLDFKHIQTSAGDGIQLVQEMLKEVKEVQDQKGRAGKRGVDIEPSEEITVQVAKDLIKWSEVEGRLDSWSGAKNLSPKQSEARKAAVLRIKECRKEHPKVLNLGSLGLDSLPLEIGELTQLTTLNLYDNELKSLPQEIGKLKQLEYLELEGNAIKELPESLGNLKNLKRLNLSRNQLTTLPENIGNLTDLQRLNINYNPLEKLPLSLTHLSDCTLQMAGKIYKSVQTAMEELQSSKIGIASKARPSPASSRASVKTAPAAKLKWEDQISQWVNEEGIDNVQKMSRGIAQKKIQRCKDAVEDSLSLSGLGLTSLPEGIFKLGHLLRLNLSGNSLIHLSEDIGKLTILEVLNLSHNRLESLPASFWKFTQLEQLDASNNHLQTFPDEIFEIGSLKVLYVQNNDLQRLPEHIDETSELLELDLSNNQLSSLPQSLSGLKSLTRLVVSGNDISNLSDINFGTFTTIISDQKPS